MRSTWSDLALETALGRYLDPDDECSNSLEYCGVALAGFNSEVYPKNGESRTEKEIIQSLNKEMPKWLTKAQKKLVAEKIEKFDIHIFCLPFRDVEVFRKALVEELSRTL